MAIKETFKNAALSVLKGIGAAYIPAVPSAALLYKSTDDNNDQHTKQGENYECSQ